MAQRRRLARRTRVAVLPLLVVTVVSAGTLSASGAPPTIPAPLPSLTNNDAGLLRGIADVGAPKVVVTVPVQVQHVYAAERNVIDAGAGTLTNYTRAWVMTTFGKTPTYGVFPTVTTTVLGFGAIPVQADLHLTQTVTGRFYDPVNVLTVGGLGQPSAADPSITTAKATVVARLDRVSVDGVPLDVGPTCVSSVPITLSLKGTFTGFDSKGRVKPGEYNLFFGGRLSGTFVIPSFAGCGAGGQDLDPLLTGAISGPDNSLVLVQGALGSYDPTFPNNCRAGSGRKAKPCVAPAPLPPVQIGS